MATSVRKIFQERKFSFLFMLTILLITLAILFLTNDTIDLFPYYFSFSYLRRLSSSPYDSSLSSSPQHATVPSPNPSPIITLSPSQDIDFPQNDSFLFDKSTSRQIPDDDLSESGIMMGLDVKWKRCSEGPDYIPCLDNMKAIKRLKSRKHMEHRERLCPKPASRCLVPLPKRYKVTLPWPKSKDMIWYDNVPHLKLVEYKKDQNWVRKSGPFFVFPGGGTQFKDGVIRYISFIQRTLPVIEWGKNVRVVLDVGCGVASFGGSLLEKKVITLSFAPKDEHEAQIQFALERGIPATLAVIGTQKLPFPSNVYDVIHCARCRVRWHGYGGRPLLELNRVLRPGGFFIWSATPVYKYDQGHRNVWNAMESLTKSMCWKRVVKTRYSRVGFVIYQKPDSSFCYKNRNESNPPLCREEEKRNSSWYAPLISCLSRLPVDHTGKLLGWPSSWPERLTDKPVGLSTEPDSEEMFYEDTKHWKELISDISFDSMTINWTRVRNVMDMNAGYGGFAAALIDQPLWVMNVIPIDAQDTLSVIFDRGLIGMYHDWCESFNTYPRSYDLLHSSFLFGYLSERCDMLDVAVEMDRIVRPGGYLVVQDSMEMINKLNPILLSLQWDTKLYRGQFLICEKSFWRP